jgi:hypothetical protein
MERLAGLPSRHELGQRQDAVRGGEKLELGLDGRGSDVGGREERSFSDAVVADDAATSEGSLEERQAWRHGQFPPTPSVEFQGFRSAIEVRQLPSGDGEGYGVTGG